MTWQNHVRVDAAWKPHNLGENTKTFAILAPILTSNRRNIEYFKQNTIKYLMKSVQSPMK